jgi:3-dehydro-L-gulonate 2-dehydrogenase
VADAIVEHLHAPLPDGEYVRYPGERTLETRRRNLDDGVPVEPAIWAQVQGFLAG